MYIYIYWKTIKVMLFALVDIHWGTLIEEMTSDGTIEVDVFPANGQKVFWEYSKVYPCSFQRCRFFPQGDSSRITKLIK